MSVERAARLSPVATNSPTVLGTNQADDPSGTRLQVGLQFALVELKNRPPISELTKHPPTSVPVPADLLRPKCTARLWRSKVSGTSVPEAPVHEHRDPGSTADQVRTTWHVPRIASEPYTRGPHGPAKEEFRLRVFRANLRHRPRTNGVHRLGRVVGQEGLPAVRTLRGHDTPEGTPPR